MVPKLELRIWQGQSSADTLPFGVQTLDVSGRPGLTNGVWPSAEPWTGRLKKLDSESIKSQEIIYNQDFNIAQLERRIARMQGEVWLIHITHKWLTMVAHYNDSFQVNNEEKTALEERLAEAGFQIEAFWLALRGLLWLADESEIEFEILIS